MEILASCSLEECLGYKGNLVIPSEDGKHSDKVSLNIKLLGGENLKSLPKSVKCVTYIGSVCTVIPPELKGLPIFNEVEPKDLGHLEDSLKVAEGVGVITLVRLPEGYCNMLKLVAISNRYPNVRFIGGNLLSVGGVNIGRFKEKGNLGPVFNGVYDKFLEVELSSLDGIQEKVRKNRKKLDSEKPSKSSGKKKSGSVSVKKTPKRKEALNSLFTGSANDF